MANKVNIRCMATTTKDIFSFVLSSEDGTPITHQEVIDTLCEYMLILEEQAKEGNWSSKSI